MPNLSPPIREAQKRWITANIALQQGKTEAYFKHAEALFDFMQHNGLEPKDLVPMLSKVNIVPESFLKLQAIQATASEYGAYTATINESRECELVLKASKLSSFFMNCTMDLTKKATPDLNWKTVVASI